MTQGTLSAIELGAALHVLERELVAAVLAGIPAGLRIAAAVGIDSPAIESRDLRLIYVACETSGGERSTALGLAKRALLYFGLWGGPWTDETLVELSSRYWGRPAPVRECAEAVVGLWQEWEGSQLEAAPKYADAARLANITPIRMGLALVKLAQLSGVPLEWIHADFARRCEVKDGIDFVRAKAMPESPIQIFNVPLGAKGAA